MAQVGIYGNYGAGGVVVYDQDLYYTPEQFGAVGDGVTLDTISIQAAINAANAAGGKQVFFSKKTYLTGGLTLLSNVTLIGASRNESIIRQRDGVAVTLISATAKTNIGVKNLSLDGNDGGAVGLASAIVLEGCSQIALIDLNIYDTCYMGIYSGTTTSHLKIAGCRITNSGVTSGGHGIMLEDTFDHVKICGNFVSGSGAYGIHYIPLAGIGSDLSIIQNSVENNGTIGIYIAGTLVHPISRAVVTDNICLGNRDNLLIAGAVDSVISNNVCHHSVGDAAGDGLVVVACVRTSIIGNTCYDNRARGILVTGPAGLENSYLTIIGNVVYRNNRDDIATVNGIDLLYVTDSIIANNVSSDTPGSARQFHGIGEDATCARNLFINNEAVGNITAPFSLAGTTRSRTKAILAGNGAYPVLGTANGSFEIPSTDELWGIYEGLEAGTGGGWIQVMRNDGATAYRLILQPAGGRVGIGKTNPMTNFAVNGLPSYANDAAALLAGATSGDFYCETGTNPLRVCREI